MKKVFVYGTLMHPGVFQAVTAWMPYCEGPAQLPGYSYRERGRLGPHPTIEPDPDGSVAGMIYKVGLDELASLDRYEGVPYYYTRHEVTIAGEPVMVYIQNGGADEEVEGH